jgi:hypothetical protein
MNKEFVPYQIALDMKSIGFDEPCAAKYNKGSFQNNSLGTWNDYNDSTWGLSLISAPLKQQAFRFFREKYGYYCFVFKFDEGFGYETYKEGVTQTNESFDTYEEAELACLIKLIEIVKNK